MHGTIMFNSYPFIPYLIPFNFYPLVCYFKVFLLIGVLFLNLDCLIARICVLRMFCFGWLMRIV
jgi:hypothetical protein